MARKGYLLATVGTVATAAAGGSVQAADMGMPVKAMPLPAPSVSWAGWYVGVNAGAAWQQMTGGYGPNGVSDEVESPGSISGSTFIGGGQVGYNWQDGNFVYGLEGDFSGLTKGNINGGSGFEANKGPTMRTSMDWLSTVRGRAGLAVGNTMVYMTGGLAIGRVHDGFAANGFNSDSVAFKNVTKTKVGWTVGGGVEHMLSQNWTVGVEALFVDLGNSTTNFNFDGTNKVAKFSNQAGIGRLKLNYKW